MRFYLGDLVNVKSKNYSGEIIQIESKRIINPVETVEFNKYLIKIDNKIHKWHFENELEYDLQIDSVMEEEIRKFLIDVNLKNRNFEMVKILASGD